MGNYAQNQTDINKQHIRIYTLDTSIFNASNQIFEVATLLWPKKTRGQYAIVEAASSVATVTTRMFISIRWIFECQMSNILLISLSSEIKLRLNMTSFFTLLIFVCIILLLGQLIRATFRNYGTMCQQYQCFSYTYNDICHSPPQHPTKCHPPNALLQSTFTSTSGKGTYLWYPQFIAHS